MCNLGDSNDDRNSSFAPLIIHGIALANVSGAACPHPRARAHTRTRWLGLLSTVTRTWVVHGYVRKWAPVEDRSTSARRIYVWERKIIHHVRGHPKLAVVDGRCFGHRFSGRARHKIDERLWLIYYAEKNALKFIMIGVRLTIFFVASSTRTFLPIVPARGRRSDYTDYEWS